MEVINRQIYLDTLSKGLETAWLRQRHTDVNVKLNGKTYACHKLLLGSFSPFFNNTLIGDENTVELNDISEKVFEQLLEYMYTGKYDSVKENAEEVLKASVKVQLKSLQDIVEDFLRSRLCHENCIQYFKLAQYLGCSALQKHSWAYMLEHFPKIIQENSFKCLAFDDLLAFINDNDLNTQCEETVCDAVLSWITHDPESRSQYLTKIVDHIRFPLMEISYIENLCQNPVVVKSNYGEKLIKICNDLLSNGDVSGVVNPRQFYNRTEEMLCAIGSRSRQPNPETTEVKCYSFNRDLTFTMAKLPNDPGACFAACSSNNDIYISGGYMKLSQMLRFKATENQWEICGSLVEGRWGHGMASAVGNIYVFGGNKKQLELIDSIEKYDIASNVSSVVGSISIPVSFPSVAVVGSHVYIFGGKTGKGVVCPKVQRFDTKTNTCSVITDLPVVSSSTSRYAVIEDAVFLFYGSGEVVKYKEDEAPAVVGRIPKFDHFGVVNYNNMALLDGSFGNKSSTIVFDPSTGVVTPFRRDIKVNMCNFYCMKVVIRKNAAKPSA